MERTAPRRGGGNDWLREALPKLVLSPSFAIVLIFVYGFILFTVYLSFTDSRILPSFGWVGLENYRKLFGLRAWGIAVHNLLIFGSLYIVICCALGLLLAIGRSLQGSSFALVRGFCVAYVDIFRSLPAIVIIYLVCFGVPLMGIPVISDGQPMFYAIIALSLTYAAYNGEQIRAGEAAAKP